MFPIYSSFPWLRPPPWVLGAFAGSGLWPLNTPESRIRAGGGARASPDRAASASAVTAACAADGGWTARPQGCRSMVASVPADTGGAPRPPASPGALPFTLHPSHLIHSNEVSPPSSPPRSPGTPRGSAEADGGDFVRLPGAASSPAGKLSPSPPVHQTHWHTLLLARGTRLVAAWLCKRQVTANREGVSPTRRPRHPSSGPVVAVGTGGSRPPVRARAGGARRAPRASRGAFQRRTREWL